ncbi:DNA/RNA nuclease SfsA [Paraglaciecola polaris]|uniref:Sugar fermentation stimulation protein homolog n=1 Tax=Paraglaciecola polaris LMG 21857 TaxID=1129793 RepID=K6YI75_9ALTE|nr:DNA/RNA nuclease SfsA [Paraglaciecola polaris]GAC32429.1 sugar fermentation stimulation protein A [Paraglaciecola polaris LMG 21857]|tara:strand:- start:6174 stop:6878 length:705 start_codon:yes stop_codon:yes gene_type:complete
MQFNNSLIKGVLIKRYKRFLADVTLENGQEVIAHCPNTGAMTGCAEANMQVWLSPSNNPKRKLDYTWQIGITAKGHWLGINTNNANKVVGEALEQQRIPELGEYDSIQPEVRFGHENSRVDFLLTGDGQKDCYLEVKSVTLLEGEQGYFPDAKTVRGQKHLRELTSMVEQGNRAVLLFCVQHTGIRSVKVAGHIDPKYAQCFIQALAEGVEVMAYSCDIDEQNITLNQRLPVIT